jgi:hypothetical protein
MSFRTYTYMQFKAILDLIAKKHGAPGVPTQVTDIFKKESPELWEHIFCVPTKNPAVEIIIYSSVDISTNKTRDYGKDRVRAIFRWRTKNGYIYHKGQWRNRVDSLDENLDSTIEWMMEGSFNLGQFKSWVDSPAKVG